jgi:hypothetical protein
MKSIIMILFGGSYLFGLFSNNAGILRHVHIHSGGSGPSDEDISAIWDLKSINQSARFQIYTLRRGYINYNKWTRK